MPVILLSYGKFKIRIAQNLTKETSRSSALSLNYHVNIGFLVKKKVIITTTIMFGAAAVVF